MPRITPNDLPPKRIAQLYATGMSLNEIGARFGVTRQLIRKVLDHYHVEIRSHEEQTSISQRKRTYLLPA